MSSGPIPAGSPWVNASGNAGKAVENGLSTDEAIKAMTLSAAEIFSVSDRLGSLETGKIANLTIARGNLLDRTTRIAYLFIDGRQIDLRAAGPGQAQPQAAPTPTETAPPVAWYARLGRARVRYE